MTAPCFDVDNMLGRLAKWLRILGFDAEYPRSTSRPGRIFVTAKEVAAFPTAIRVTTGAVEDQLSELFNQAGIDPNPELFFSRCLICNVPVEEISRDKTEGKVPEAVWQTTTHFNECPRCRRIYWEGTHGNRIKKRLAEAGVRGFTSASVSNETH